MTGPSDAPRLRIGVVGVGPVGAVLGAALQRAGHRVVAVSAVSATAVRRAQRWLPDADIAPADEVVAASDLVLLTVPEDQLPDLVRGLAVTGAWRRGHLAVHTSGAHGIAVFDPAVPAGVVGMAIHPMTTFSGGAEDSQRLVGCLYGITAPEDFRPAAEMLVLQLGGEAVWIPEPARPRYDAAMSMASDHLVTLVGDAVETLASAGVADPAALLAPLLSSALDSALRRGDDALNGPAVRGDRATVERHIAALAGTPQLRPYLASVIRTMQRAHGNGRLSQAHSAEIIAAIEQSGGLTDT